MKDIHHKKPLSIVYSSVNNGIHCLHCYILIRGKTPVMGFTVEKLSFKHCMNNSYTLTALTEIIVQRTVIKIALYNFMIFVGIIPLCCHQCRWSGVVFWFEKFCLLILLNIFVALFYFWQTHNNIGRCICQCRWWFCASSEYSPIFFQLYPTCHIILA